MKTWAEIFAPTGYSLRPGQEELGNEIIRIIESGGTLVAQASTGTGKSLATSIPTINKIHEMRAEGKPTPRSVISTETITLQSQLCDKDLPFLQNVYGGFKFAKLLGRSNYLCMNRFKERAIGNPEVAAVYTSVNSNLDRIKTGEYNEICNILGYQIPKSTWSEMVGNSDDCSNDKSCEDGNLCLVARAREIAEGSDIVVVNHALLGADHRSKMMGSEDGILGPIDILVVDEAHKLEEVLSSQWTESTTEWDVKDNISKISAGVKHMKSLDSQGINELLEQYAKFFDTAMHFFYALNEYKGSQDWQGSETKFALHYLTRPPQKVRDLMLKYEEMGPPVLDAMVTTMKKIMATYASMMDDSQGYGLTKSAKSEMKKSASAAKFLANICEIMRKAMDTKDGIVSHMGTVYGVVADGWRRRKDNTISMTIRCFPVDVSGAARMFGQSKSSILLSATMSDLTDGTFKYFKRSLGVTDAKEVDVKSPFNMDSQQLVYVTQANAPCEPGAKFSAAELVNLINASDGRSLVLFTSRREIEMARDALNAYKVQGLLPYPMYVQEPDADKAKLVEDFKRDTNSVLLGLKSMFTGIDIPGESLSQVIICRWPLPRFSTETRMKMDYWRKVGFPKWYERESLTVFQQAAGRLIRSDKCIGVVSLIDQRAYDVKENVYKTDRLGVKSLGSRVTHDPTDITKHLIKVNNETI